MGLAGPFEFQTEHRLVLLTGERASTLPELAQLVRTIPGSSIFYHTHHMFLAHHFERPTFTNDFANWAGEALQEDELSEKLAAVDLLEHTSIQSIRDALTAALDAIGERRVANVRHCPAGDEFHFCRAKSFIIPTGLAAQDPADLFRQLRQIGKSSLFFHYVEARLRLGRTTDDFSEWLEARGESRLSRALAALDPYAVTLDELKQQMIRLGERYFGETLV